MQEVLAARRGHGVEAELPDVEVDPIDGAHAEGDRPQAQADGEKLAHAPPPVSMLRARFREQVGSEGRPLSVLEQISAGVAREVELDLRALDGACLGRGDLPITALTAVPGRALDVARR